MAPRRAQERAAETARRALDNPRCLSDHLNPDEAVALQLKQFLDEWYYRILHSSIAKDMSRWEALRALLEVLEMVGVRFSSDGEKDEIAAMQNEEGVITRIVDCMPMALREQWEHVCLQLQTVVHATTRVRKAAEVTGDDADEAVSGIFEDANDEGMLQQILKGAIVFSSKNVAKLRGIHATWRKSTEARIERMARLQDQADNNAQELIALEAQLSELGATAKNKHKSMLASLANGQDSALKHSCFASWRGVIMTLQTETGIRKRFEDRISEAEAKLLEFKAKQLENVRGVMTRLCGEEDVALMRDVWTFWTDEVRIQKDAMGKNSDELKRVQEQLASLQREGRESAKRVMGRLAGNNASALIHLHFQAWMDFGRLFKQEMEMENAVKNTQLRLKKQLDEKKGEARRILDKLGSSTDTGLMTVMLQHWIEYTREEKDARAMDEAMNGQAGFKTLAARHRARALSVQTRVNAQKDLNIKQHLFSTWLLEMRVNGINYAFMHKYASKKRQLQGVQNLFRSFAVQLEQNLGGDDEEPSASSTRVSSRVPSSKRSSNGKQHRGMARDNMGASSLPDIHSRDSRGYRD